MHMHCIQMPELEIDFCQHNFLHIDHLTFSIYKLQSSDVYEVSLPSHFYFWIESKDSQVLHCCLCANCWYHRSLPYIFSIFFEIEGKVYWFVDKNLTFLMAGRPLVINCQESWGNCPYHHQNIVINQKYCYQL